jgi:hypothetical protein
MYVALQDIELSTIVQRGRRTLKIAPTQFEDDDTETRNSFVTITPATEVELTKWRLAIEAFTIRTDA